MYVNEVTIRPRLEVDSVPSEQMPQSGNPTTISIENVINISHEGSSKADTNSSTLPPPASPSPSARSSSISIASIETDAASSVIESDIDEYEDTNTGCMVKKLGQQTPNTEPSNPLSNLSPEIAVLLGQKIENDVAGSNGPQIASLSLTNSTDVTFGHKKYHKGPVTIQQILMEKPAHRGNDNPAFDGSAPVDRTKEREPGPQNEDRPPSQAYKNVFNHRIAVITAIIVLITLVLGIVVVTVTNFIRDGRLLNVNDINEEKSLLMISRDEWVAQPPNVPLGDLEAPISRVIITHTATQNCTTKPMCIFRTRFIQTFDVESRSYDDIRYNFLVGGDGNVYVGRGWDKIGAHTDYYNEDSIGIAFIGTFNRWAPPETQLNATQWLLSEGIRLKKLDPDYKLYGSRQLDLTDGPGDVLYDIITKWPHWSNVTINL